MYGIGAYFAILNAVKEFNPGKDLSFSSDNSGKSSDEFV